MDDVDLEAPCRGRDYYLSQVANGVEDYYTGRGEVVRPLDRHRRHRLGLASATRRRRRLRAVLAGLHPGTGQSPNGGPPTVLKGRVPAST